MARGTILFVSLVCLFETTTFAQSGQRPPSVTYPLEFAVSPPARDLPPSVFDARGTREIPLHRPSTMAGSGDVADPVQQTSTTTLSSAQSAGQWEGLGAGYPGFSVTAVPPDPNIAVGPNHVVQWVNNAFAVWDKQGTQVQAPIADSTFWGALSTCYQLGGFSDPIVQYDGMADRWVVGEVAIPLIPGLLGQYAQCFAVSKTSDPTGAYYMWAYGFGTNINDYPKIGVWPDGYYVTWNIFKDSTTFIGPEACAFDRNAMVSGASAPALVCFQLNGALYASLLPSDLDGASLPPTGSPNFMMNVDSKSGALNLWRLHADFVQTNNSTLTGPISIAGVAPFTSPCIDNPDCIPQPGTTMKLDALGDRLMYRLAYRNFGDHESLAANHTVLTAGGNTAVRWYEVRSPNATPAIFQQGTFAPDADNRWMASVAMDQTGNIAVGYSVASALTYPSIRFTGWEIGNTLGELQAETFAVNGGGSQTGYDRWGDYSAMRIDPADDCTFYYTQEYQATTASANWNTRVLSFRFPSCGQALTATTTSLTSSANPSAAGMSVTFTAAVAPSAATGTIEFFDGGVSLGTVTLSGGTASLSTASLSAGSHAITAAYSGDSAYLASTSPVLTQTVSASLIDTTTSLATTPNPSAYGQSVVFTAGVSPSSGTGTPTGSITFLDGATVLGSSALDSNGLATFSTSSLSIGTHSLTAQYSGDGVFAGSTSSATLQTVNKTDTTIGLTSNHNPSNNGQPVTFKATVSPSMATGIVQFFDGSTLLGGVALASGSASLTVSGLSVGSHSITATYSGDGNYNGSTSGVLTQVVRKKK